MSVKNADARSVTPEVQRPTTPKPTSHIHSPPNSPAKSSIRSRKTPHNGIPLNEMTRPRLAALPRFRSAVRRVIALHRGTNIPLAGIRERGAEPGVNPRSAHANNAFAHIKQDCNIEIVDYSAIRIISKRLTNSEFISLLQDPKASARDPWVRVRWINVGGVDWQVLKAIAIKYGLHPLSLEDVLHRQAQSRSKVDYYMQHLFLRVLCHEIAEDDFMPDEAGALGSTLDDRQIMSDNEDEVLSDYDEEKKIQARTFNKRHRKRPMLPNRRHDLRAPDRGISLLASKQANALEQRQQQVKQDITIKELKKEDRVVVKVQPMYIFLLRDGTVISMHTSPTSDFAAPIAVRLRQRDTSLRTSSDASLLVYSLLDLIVDRAMLVIDAYQDKIRKFERDILMHSRMKTVSALHVLSGDLILHKRSLEPIKKIIYALRRFDQDKVAALTEHHSGDPSTPVVGYMSHKSKIYLADVYDHMEYILTSIDMFAGIAENLINYSFNAASYEMNQTMRVLTIVTLIFLPLSLLSGYFGMNFTFMWGNYHGHSDLVYWVIALPMMAIILPLALWGDIESGIAYMKKKLGAKKAVNKAYQQS